MANSYLVLAANGSIGTGANWALCDATSVSDSEAANTALTTSYVTSTTFTPGAITIDALLVKLASRNAAPSGTMTVALDQGGSDVAGTIVTVNISDLPLCTTAGNEGGWFCFKFSAPVTLLGATAYGVKAKTSVSSMVNLYSSATTNWSRQLRTTTTQAPGTTDSLIITGEWTAAATVTARSCTMDSTSTSNILQNNGASGAINVCNNGTLAYGTTASTAYYLKLGPGTVASDMRVYAGGTLTMGTLGTPMPSSSSAVLEFNITLGQADGLSGLTVKNLGTFNAYGATVGACYTSLTADASAAATSLTVGSTSGWVAGDTIVIASTSRTPTETESRVITTVTDATHVAIPALTNAHGGGVAVALVTAEVIHLNRNVKIRSNQTANQATAGSAQGSAYINVKATAVVAMQYVEMSYLGSSTTGQRGLENETTSAAATQANIQYCSLHDFRNGGLYVIGASGSITFSNNVMATCNTAQPSGFNVVQMAGTSGVHVFDRNYFIGCTPTSASNSGVMLLNDVGSTFTNNVVAGCSGSVAGAAVAFNQGSQGGINYGWVLHSNGLQGLSTQINTSALVAAFGSATAQSYCWRNGGQYGLGTTAVGNRIIFDSWTVFGNAGNQITVGPNGMVWIKSCTVRGDASFSSVLGLNASQVAVYITDSTFGVGAAHTNEDILINGQVFAWNTTLASATPVTWSSASTAQGNLFVRVQKYGGVSTDHRAFFLYGNVQSEGTIRHTASGLSWKLAPNANSASYLPLCFPGPTPFDTFKVALPSGLASSVIVSCWVLLASYTSGTKPTLHVPAGILAGTGGFGVNGTTFLPSDAGSSVCTETVHTITAATNASPIAITSTAHGFSTGDLVYIAGVVGNTAANGTWTITVTDVDHFTLNTSTGNGAYTSGGTASRWQQLTVTLSGGSLPTEAGALEAYITLDGTQTVYVDDFAVTAT